MLESLFLVRRCACNLRSNKTSASQGAQERKGAGHMHHFYLAFLMILLSPALYEFLELNTRISGWFAKDGTAFCLGITFTPCVRKLEWQKNGFMSLKGTVKGRYPGTPLIHYTSYGSHSHQFHKSIQKHWALGVPF